MKPTTDRKRVPMEESEEVTPSGGESYTGDVQTIPLSAMAGSVHTGTNNHVTLQNAYTVQEIFNQANITNTDVRLNIEVHDNKAPIMFGSYNTMLNQPTFSDVETTGNKERQPTILPPLTKNLIDLTAATLEKHRKRCFVETNAFRGVKERLHKYGIAILNGRIGDGKTLTSFEAMDRVRVEEGKIPIQIQSGSSWQAAINIKSKHIVLIEDIFGKGSFRLDLVKSWLPYFHSIRTCIEHGNIYVLITSRKDIMSEAMRHISSLTDEVNGLFSKSQIVDFTKEYQLTIDEKRAILQKHISSQKQHPNAPLDRPVSSSESRSGEIRLPSPIRYAEDLILRQETVVGFPMMCSMFVGNIKLGVRFFQTLCPQLLKEIRALYYNDKLKYFTIVYMFLNNEFMNLNTKKLFALSKEENDSLYEIADRCGVTISKGLPAAMKDSAEILEGVFLKFNRVYQVYEFINSSVVDAVCLTHGENFPKEVLQKCSDSFICGYVCTTSCSNDDHPCLKVIQENYAVLAERITNILLKDVRQFCNLQPLDDESFVDDLFLYLGNSQNLESFLQIVCRSGFNDHSLIYFSANKTYFLTKLFEHGIAEHHDPGFLSSEVDLALERALRKGNMESVKLLCENGAFLADDSLSIAIKSGLVEFVNQLIQNYDFPVEEKHKALCHSCGIGDLDMAKHFLEEQHTVPNVRCLIAAVLSNCHAMFTYVFNSRRWSVENRTEVLELACRRGHKEIIEHLEKEGAVFTSNCLTHAVESLNIDVLEYLLRSKVWDDDQKTTALDIACSKGRIDMIKTLQKYGALFSDRSLLKAASSNLSDVFELVMKSKSWTDEQIQEVKEFARDKRKTEILEYLELNDSENETKN